mmetsp:Transcript_36226/g.62229  ORF Transcript_36226/g.62229 Transcript_36226/m.62229 type:complete len:296 (-) Transcript_36226:525-1412(-)
MELRRRRRGALAEHFPGRPALEAKDDAQVPGPDVAARDSPEHDRARAVHPVRRGRQDRRLAQRLLESVAAAPSDGRADDQGLVPPSLLSTGGDLDRHLLPPPLRRGAAQGLRDDVRPSHRHDRSRRPLLLVQLHAHRHDRAVPSRRERHRGGSAQDLQLLRARGRQGLLPRRDCLPLQLRGLGVLPHLLVLLAPHRHGCLLRRARSRHLAGHQGHGGVCEGGRLRLYQRPRQGLSVRRRQLRRVGEPARVPLRPQPATLLAGRLAALRAAGDAPYLVPHVLAAALQDDGGQGEPA